MERQKYSDRLTYLTLASALIGFLAYTVSPFLLTLYAGVVLIPKYHPFDPHSLRTVASLTSTTLVFGIINGFTCTALQEYSATG